MNSDQVSRLLGEVESRIESLLQGRNALLLKVSQGLSSFGDIPWSSIEDLKQCNESFRLMNSLLCTLSSAIKRSPHWHFTRQGLRSSL